MEAGMTPGSAWECPHCGETQFRTKRTHALSAAWTILIGSALIIGSVLIEVPWWLFAPLVVAVVTGAVLGAPWLASVQSSDPDLLDEQMEHRGKDPQS